MLKMPDISFEHLLNSKAKEDKFYRFLYLTNLLFIGVILLAVGLESVHLFDNNYYPLEMSMLGISIPSFYFLVRGSKKTAVNFINLLPIPIYILIVSPILAIFPPQQSYFLHVFLLSAGILFLVIFADHISQLLTFILISVFSLAFHFYSTGNISNCFMIFWTSREVLPNPIFLFILISAFSVLLFNIFHSNSITLKKKIAEKEANFQNVFYKYPAGIIRIRIERDEMGEKSGLMIEQINPDFENYFDLRNSEIKGKSVALVFQGLFKNEINWQEIFLNRSKNQHEIYIPQTERWYKILVMYPNSNQIISFFEDVTELRNSLKEVENSKYRYKLLIETIPDIFFVIDKDGTYIDYVAKEEEGFKFSPEEIIGSTIFEVGYSKKMVSQVYNSIQAVINHNVIETIEYVLEIFGKGSCFFEMRMVKLSENSVMAISRDITKQKIAQQKIEEAKKKAEEADQLKSAFLQNISHEVRTPLNAIVGFSNVLLTDDEIKDNDRQNYLQLIIRNGHILLHVFNNTIKLSRLQSGLITIEKKINNLNGIMSDLYRHFLFEKEQLGKDHLKITLFQGTENIKFSVYIDGQKIKDILESLLDNAVKFTRKGEIYFGYRIVNGGMLEFFVSDTGIGIPENKFKEIFQRFYQLDSSMTREYGGTGIGLSLAKDFADLLGTEINVQSTEGKGSRFSFVIPMEAEEGHLKIV